MSKKMFRIGGFIGSVAVTAALVGAAASGTGAYFTDSKSGAVSGTMGSIKIDGFDNADGLNIAFTNMLPGERQTQSVNFYNSGQNVQDVWVVFDKTALGSAAADIGLNSRGTFAEVGVASGGEGQIFWSNNLNDGTRLNGSGTSTCPQGTGAPITCNGLPRMLKLHDSLAPGARGTFEFSYTPGYKFKNNALALELNLPYTLVATQHGISPSNEWNTVQYGN